MYMCSIVHVVIRCPGGPRDYKRGLILQSNWNTPAHFYQSSSLFFIPTTSIMKFLGLFVISTLLAVCNAAPSVLEARCTDCQFPAILALE